MAVPKRTRYEVLRRDGFACRYCGATAPDVKLHVDHVMPTALGGSDDPGNLVAACVDCNNGKASTSPDEETVSGVALDAQLWAEARREAISKIAEAEARIEEDFTAFYIAWTSWDANAQYLPGTAESTFRNWLSAGLTLDDILRAHNIALGARHVSIFKVWRYMCGVLRNRLARIEAETAAILSGGEV